MEKIKSKKPERYPFAEPKIKMNLRYKFLPPGPSFYKYVPKVHSDAINFDFADKDYQHRESDRKHVDELNALIEQGNGTVTSKSGEVIKQEKLTYDDMERFIDSLDKIYQKTKNKSDQQIVHNFYKRKDEPNLLKKLHSATFLIERMIPHWKKTARQTRKFWENPDYDDPDNRAAFRKRFDQPKMQLRQNADAIKKKLE